MDRRAAKTRFAGCIFQTHMYICIFKSWILRINGSLAFLRFKTHIFFLYLILQTARCSARLNLQRI